jgi:hypothetical protein
MGREATMRRRIVKGCAEGVLTGISAVAALGAPVAPGGASTGALRRRWRSVALANGVGNLAVRSARA